MTSLDPAVAELRESPFFVLSGPAGRVLSCQWASWSAVAGRAQGCEFEIVCPETPETMGMLYGLYEDGAFRMRPAVDCRDRGATLAPQHDLDQSWRGSIDDVLAVGHDWRMGEDGILEIADPEEPAPDRVADALAMAA